MHECECVEVYIAQRTATNYKYIHSLCSMTPREFMCEVWDVRCLIKRIAAICPCTTLTHTQSARTEDEVRLCRFESTHPITPHQFPGPSTQQACHKRALATVSRTLAFFFLHLCVVIVPLLLPPNAPRTNKNTSDGEKTETFWASLTLRTDTMFMRLFCPGEQTTIIVVHSRTHTHFAVHSTQIRITCVGEKFGVPYREFFWLTSACIYNIENAQRARTQKRLRMFFWLCACI